MRKIQTAVIGLGLIGKAHIDAIRRLGWVDIVAVCDQASAQITASSLCLPDLVSEYSDILSSPNIEAIHICTPNHLHYEIAQQAIEKGKHVFSEKPLGMTQQETYDLASLSQKHPELVLGVNFNYRMFPIVQEIRFRVLSGKLGKVYLVNGKYLQDWLLYDTDFNWRILRQYAGNTRALADIGSHLIDLVEYVTNDKITSLVAQMDTFIPQRVGPDGSKISIDTEDSAALLVKFSSGATGNLQISQVSAGHKNDLQIEVSGAKGSLAWAQEDCESLWMGKRDGDTYSTKRNPAFLSEEAKQVTVTSGGHSEGWPDAFRSSIEAFYTAIQTGETPKCATFINGHRSMVCIDAVLESVKTKSWVDVPSEFKL
jgi:predicted dehydrogenase